MAGETGQPPEPMDWDALARHLAGEGSDADSGTMRRWLEAHPDEARAIGALDTAASGLRRVPPPGLDVAAAWRRVSGRLDEPVAPKVLPMPERRPVWRSPALRVAAAIALVAAGGVIWRMSGSAPAGTAVVTAARTIVTAPGQRDSVVLADGTGVLLGPGSSLRVEEGYGSGRRDVHLEGDALFDVRHDATMPFAVSASDVMIRDVGTTFAVHAPSDADAMVVVVVTSGIVQLAPASAPPDSGVLLHAGDIGTAGQRTPIVVRRSASPEDELEWTRGRLIFRDTPLPRVAAALRQWYGVQVLIADSTLNGRTLTASFQGEPLAQVLQVMSLALDARVERRDSTVVIDRAPQQRD